MGQIIPDTVVTSTTNLRDESKSTFKTNVEPEIDPLFADLSKSINASVKGYNEGLIVTGII